MARVWSLIERAGPTDANVLILGENGTGKELVARELHRRSRRAGQPMVSVDLGAVAENLFECELFGHVKGAFTDARADRIGRMQAADSGTLFLDEIGNLPLHLQPKLLTALEQRQVVPVGANKPVPIDVRVIAATNCPAEQLGRREAASARTCCSASTRSRSSCRRCASGARTSRCCSTISRPICAEIRQARARRCPPDVLRALEAYDWPGNVRALRHAAERAVILADGDAFASRISRCPQPARTAAPPPTARRHDLNLDRPKSRWSSRR